MARVFLTMLFEDPRLYVLIVVVVMVSVVLHELGHALAATWEGDPTPRLRGHFTWNPVVHMGWLALALLAVVGVTFGRTPVTPAYFRHRRWGEAIVAFAGPATNLVLALVATVVLATLAGLGRLDLHDRGSFVSLVTGAHASLAAVFWFQVLWMNVTLFFLNMIPLPPLDGFTVAEGTFDLGEIGPTLRRAGFLPLIVAILIVNSGPFQTLLFTVIGFLLGVAGAFGA